MQILCSRLLHTKDAASEKPHARKSKEFVSASDLSFFLLLLQKPQLSLSLTANKSNLMTGRFAGL